MYVIKITPKPHLHGRALKRFYRELTLSGSLPEGWRERPSIYWNPKNGRFYGC